MPAAKFSCGPVRIGPFTFREEDAAEGCRQCAPGRSTPAKGAAKVSSGGCQGVAAAADRFGVDALFLSYDRALDWLEAAPYGVVMDRQGHDRWRAASDEFGWFLDRPGGRPIGFKIVDFSVFDPSGLPAVFEGPRFDVPALGLRAVSAGECALALPTFLGGQSTLDRRLFDAAMEASGEQAVHLWLATLQAGNCMAHYGAGYSLLDVGEPRAAYRHLRAYTELVPNDAWAWAFRAKAAAAIGEVREAAACCREAMRLEEVYDEATDAAELLGRLDQE